MLQLKINGHHVNGRRTVAQPANKTTQSVRSVDINAIILLKKKEKTVNNTNERQTIPEKGGDFYAQTNL